MAGDLPCSRVLLVEGADDEHVIRHIANQRHPLPGVEILSKQGFPELVKAIPVEIKVSGRVVVGIVADADDDWRGRWKEIEQKLKQVNINLPKISSNGVIIEKELRIGIWLMPDNLSNGELEDFVVKMMPGNDSVWPLAKQYIDGIPHIERKFAPGKRLRAELHAWLATREFPRKMGAAIGAQDLDVNVPIATTFTEWLRCLFR